MIAVISAVAVGVAALLTELPGPEALRRRVLRLAEVPPRGEGVASYLVTLGILIAVFIPILFTLANGGVSPLISRLNGYLGSVTFP